MRRARVLLFLLLIAGGVVAYYAATNGWDLPTVPGTSAPQPGKAGGGKTVATTEPVRPSFDVVRAEQTGDLIMAGRAEPGWAVTVESNGRVVGSATADPNGEWIIQPSGSIGKGEHSLQLKSQAPGSGQTLFSKQRLALSLGDTAKTRPLVALTEEGAATRVLQMSPAPDGQQRSPALASVDTGNLPSPPVKPEPAAKTQPAPAQVSFTSVDYEQDSGRSTIFLSGRGTPGAKIVLYVDDQFVGVATVDATGSWTLKGARELGGGTHALRADNIDLSDGSKVLARAEVNFDRQVPKTATAAISTPSGSQVDVAPRSSAAASPQQQAAAAAAQKPAEAAGEGSGWKTATTSPDATAAKIDSGVIIIRRGDTLWQLAERHYGSGARYTQIFQNNREQIRNPNRIYPNQRVNVPR
jgi:hypothetical protein